MKVGLEIHQQLDTNKLFCECPSTIRDGEPDYVIGRFIRAAAGEKGKLDEAAAAEQMKRRKFIYEVYDTNCLVETDSEPPHPINRQALDIVLQVCMMLNAEVVQGAQVMRKTVADGSNTSGFQRTVLIARGGYIDTSDGRVKIDTICLEEDSARKICEKDGEVTYRLDRLGIPLIEIATHPDIKSADQCKEAAAMIGMILRSTGRVRRGVGTIRQDVNVSVPGGTRVEIKGVQDLANIIKIVDNEVMRQQELLKLQIPKKSNPKIMDVSKIFVNTGSKIVKGKNIFGIAMPRFKGTFGKELLPGIRFGTELSDHAKLAAGVKGIFHSDELPAYGIAQREVESLIAEFGESYVIVAAEEGKAYRALNAVIKRAYVKGVPGEVRRAEGINSRYLRQMPGAARMYPETDVPIIIPDTKNVSIPELIVDKAKRYEHMGMSKDLSMAAAKEIPFFDEIKSDLKPAYMAEFILNNDAQKHEFEELFSCIERGAVTKEGAVLALEQIKKGAFKTEVVDEQKLRLDIKKIIIENKDASLSALMGHVMKTYRGKVDGKRLLELIKEMS